MKPNATSPKVNPIKQRYRKLGCLLVALAAPIAVFTPTYFGLRETFFSPPVELSGVKFDIAHIAHVAAESGIVFPVGTVGLEYHYRHGRSLWLRQAFGACG